MDKATEILLAALKEAMARPDEQPLYKSGKQTGLFASRAGVAGDAARRAVEDGFLELIRSETRGKAETEYVRVTPRGVQFVCQADSPKAALEELVQSLKVNREGMPLWLEEMRAQMQGFVNRFSDLLERQGRYLDQLTKRAEAALLRLETPPEPAKPATWQLDAIDYLEKRQNVAAGSPCPLPELFHFLREKHADLSIANFHAGLDELHAQGAVTLIPFQGRLADLAEPEYALLEDAAVFFAVARRK